MIERLYINLESNTEHSYREDKEWGSWSDSKSHTISCAYTDLPSYNYWMVSEPIQFEVKEGDRVYVLLMVYSTGDSFGHSEGNVEILWVFKDSFLAHKAKDAILSQKNEFSVLVTVDSGEGVTIYNPGSGYFNSVEDVIVYELPVVTPIKDDE